MVRTSSALLHLVRKDSYRPNHFSCARPYKIYRLFEYDAEGICYNKIIKTEIECSKIKANEV